MYGVRINLVLHLCCWNCSTLGSLSIIYHAYGAREKYLFILQLVFPFIGFICAIFVMNILNIYGLLLYFIHPCFVFEEIQQTIDNRHSFHSLGWDSEFSVSFVSRLRRVSTLTYWFYSKLSRESQMLSEYCCCHCQWICWYVYAKKKVVEQWKILSSSMYRLLHAFQISSSPHIIFEHLEMLNNAKHRWCKFASLFAL